MSTEESPWKCQSCRDCGFAVRDELIHLDEPCPEGCPANIFQCAVCGQVFPKGWTDEEARQEYRDKFGREPPAPRDTVVTCDDCAEKLDGLMGLLNWARESRGRTIQ